jgi:hypothetical protein
VGVGEVRGGGEDRHFRVGTGRGGEGVELCGRVDPYREGVRGYGRGDDVRGEVGDGRL